MCDGKCSCTRRCFIEADAVGCPGERKSFTDEQGVKRYSDTGQPVDRTAYLIRRAQRLEREAFELRRLAADAA